MKLRNLKGAIRKVDGSVKTKMRVPGGGDATFVVGLVKSELMAGLDATFGPDGATETGFRIDDDGFLQLDNQ